MKACKHDMSQTQEVRTKGLPLAKSEASNSHGSVPFLSKLGDVRVSHIRKEHTELGSLTCGMSAKSARRLMLEQSSLCTWLCRCGKAGPGQLDNCGSKNITAKLISIDPLHEYSVQPLCLAFTKFGACLFQ